MLGILGCALASKIAVAAARCSSLRVRGRQGKHRNIHDTQQFGTCAAVLSLQGQALNQDGQESGERRGRDLPCKLSILDRTYKQLLEHHFDRRASAGDVLARVVGNGVIRQRPLRHEANSACFRISEASDAVAQQILDRLSSTAAGKERCEPLIARIHTAPESEPVPMPWTRATGQNA